MKMKALANRKNAALTLTLVLLFLVTGAAGPKVWTAVRVTPRIKAVLDHISAESMRGHLSFISSDLLEGRNTPSRGLDIAAEYIAAQFRRAGLEPVGDDGYFQTAHWAVMENKLEGFKLRLPIGGASTDVEASNADWNAPEAVDLSDAPIIKVAYDDEPALTALTADEVRGKAIITEIPDYRTEPRERWRDIFIATRQFIQRMAQVKPALIVSVSSKPMLSRPAGRLIDPEHRQQGSVFRLPGTVVTVHDAKLAEAYKDMKSGESGATVSAQVAADIESPVKIRNVIGLLRGSDPKLKNTYVLVTAHYDHLGMSDSGKDRIYNGANDDGSGTVSVLELASALATLKPRPRRSIVFMTFFGEEKGDLGSRYYGNHPIFPIAETVADVNLEQVGRTDSTEGPKIASASMTGYDFSDMGQIFNAAGKAVGVDVYKHPVNSDAYFSRSDNQALANLGVPAHTLCVAFDYPDYHAVGDEWPKVDYTNMAKVDRMIALGLLTIADSDKTPEWDASNPKTAQYVKAWKAHHQTSVPSMNSPGR